MTEAFQFLHSPSSGPVGDAWFADIANTLLNEAVFVVAGQPHRLLEVEFYYNGGDHVDPFAHCDPIQKAFAKWYFHRDEGSYRGGSFKGLDISFGPEGIFGGILIRTIEAPDGKVINGCSLSVDHMLAQTGFGSVAELDAAIDNRPVWDADSPVALVLQHGTLDARQIHATARVGLTLKRMYRNPTMPEFIMSTYRFLTDPRIKKGKVHTIISLHKAGHDVEAIRAFTGSTGKGVRGYIEAYNEGMANGNFNTYRGKKLKTLDLCALHGIWQREHGAA